MSQINVQVRYLADKNTWAPEESKTFTPHLLVHYQGHHTPEQVRTIAKLMYTGDIGKVTSVTDIFKHLKLDSDERFQKLLAVSTATKEESGENPCFVLIEGAPGIGKTVLLKEIAYRWGKKLLLQNFELVLLVCLRDPSLLQIKSVDDLLQLFCIGDKNATEVVTVCSKYLFANGGKSLTLLLDGYDEYPEHLRECSLVANIL